MLTVEDIYIFFIFNIFATLKYYHVSLHPSNAMQVAEVTSTFEYLGRMAQFCWLNFQVNYPEWNKLNFILISLKFVLYRQQALSKSKSWSSLLTYICITRPQWVNRKIWCIYCLFSNVFLYRAGQHCYTMQNVFQLSYIQLNIAFKLILTRILFAKT